MLVGGAGQIRITKDGKVLLYEMMIQHPTAMLIARTATAQDDITGDGTTSAVLFCGELMKQAERFYMEGLHPRVVSAIAWCTNETRHHLNILSFYGVEIPLLTLWLMSMSRVQITEGYEKAKDHTLAFLETYKTPFPDALTNRELLTTVARTSLRTKLPTELADQMTDAVVSAVQCIAVPGEAIDLHMVEIMTMQHKLQVSRKKAQLPPTYFSIPNVI
jgi:T-complex protein 1 subunit zeta